MSDKWSSMIILPGSMTLTHTHTPHTHTHTHTHTPQREREKREWHRVERENSWCTCALSLRSYNSRASTKLCWLWYRWRTAQNPPYSRFESWNDCGSCSNQSLWAIQISYAILHKWLHLILIPLRIACLKPFLIPRLDLFLIILKRLS